MTQLAILVCLASLLITTLCGLLMLWRLDRRLAQLMPLSRLIGTSQAMREIDKLFDEATERLHAFATTDIRDA